MTGQGRAQTGKPGFVYPGAEWAACEPSQAGLDRASLEKARDQAILGGGAGLVIRDGRLVFAWGDPRQRYDLKSSTKSIGVTALGLAIGDKKVSLEDRVAEALPGFRPEPGLPPEAPGRERITLWHLATQTAGFDKPGGETPLQFEPGTRWRYSDGGPNWLADVPTRACGRDLQEVLFERVFGPIGIPRSELVWRRNAYRSAELEGIPRREFGSGVSASVDAMARIGYLYLRDGLWEGRRLLPAEFIGRVRRVDADAMKLPVHEPSEYGDAARHYGLLWWNNNDGTLRGVPRDAYWSWGLYDSLIVVIPSLDLVVARAGQSWPRTPGAEHYAVLRPFLEPIVAAVTTAVPREGAPYGPSRHIVGLSWEPAYGISRAAPGSDNWPLTWAADDALYGAYGDGKGFDARDPKLSLGLARIEGGPEDFHGTNVPAPTLEQRGDGAAGLKASGLLALGGRLYLWARNAGNAQLARSDDQGRTWIWADWRLGPGLACPSFVNHGRDGNGALDGYEYVVSLDGDSAYVPADRLVLARVAREKIMERGAYEFFVGLDAGSRPEWSSEIARRGAMFRNPGHCYRSTMSYHPASSRYLMCQTLPGEDPRRQGGFGVYDAPTPWGPWTTVFFCQDWDVGPGETQCVPTKWMSSDGRALHMVFSGNDHFSVREAELWLHAPADNEEDH